MAVKIRIYQAIKVDISVGEVTGEPMPVAISPYFAPPAIVSVSCPRLAALLFQGFPLVEAQPKAKK